MFMMLYPNSLERSIYVLNSKTMPDDAVKFQTKYALKSANSLTLLTKHLLVLYFCLHKCVTTFSQTNIIQQTYVYTSIIFKIMCKWMSTRPDRQQSLDILCASFWLIWQTITQHSVRKGYTV